MNPFPSPFHAASVSPQPASSFLFRGYGCPAQRSSLAAQRHPSRSQRRTPTSDTCDRDQTIRPEADHDTLIGDPRRVRRRRRWPADVLLGNPRGPYAVTV